MQKAEDSSNSGNSEAQLPEFLLQSFKEYAGGPKIKISETTDAFILSEAKQRLDKAVVVPVKRVYRLPLQLTAGLAAVFAVFLGLTFGFWAKQRPSGLQISRTSSHTVDQPLEPTDIQDTQEVRRNRVNGNIPVIASFVVSEISVDSTEFSDLNAPQTDQALLQLAGNIYSM